MDRPAPRCFVSRFLAWRWGASVSRHADIRYPGRLTLGRGVVLGRCQIICTGPVVLGDAVEIRDYAILDAQGGPICVGARTTVNPYCVLYGAGGLRIGRNVAIATHTVIIPANHGFDDLDRPIIDQPISQEGVEIGDDVWLAARVVVLDGVKVGRGAVIAAGAVVTRDVAPEHIAAGVPARVLRSRRS